MTDLHRQSLNELYSSGRTLRSDPWLERYRYVFDTQGKPLSVIDIGCGDGTNIPFLRNVATSITCVDYSKEAIRAIVETYGIETALMLDIREKFPFAPGTFDIALCDLSLHYFERDTTIRIISEINRILTDQGCILIRVNSIKDINHGAGIGHEIDRHYWEHEGKRKRFFDSDDIEALFSLQNTILARREDSTNKYGSTKNVWEVVLGNHGHRKGDV